LTIPLKNRRFKTNKKSMQILKEEGASENDGNGINFGTKPKIK
jgi:hypothetical protein